MRRHDRCVGCVRVRGCVRAVLVPGARCHVHRADRASAQDDALATRVMTAVRAALAPALPFPDERRGRARCRSTATPTSLWMVRPLQPGDRTIEVLANPLNEVNQARADARDGADRTGDHRPRSAAPTRSTSARVAEAKRTGRSQDVDGVTLSDEGLAGARIDAESHVTIDVSFNQPSYRVRDRRRRSSPAPATPGVNPRRRQRDRRAVERVSRREGSASGSARREFQVYPGTGGRAGGATPRRRPLRSDRWRNTVR